MGKLERKVPPVALFIVMIVAINHVAAEFRSFMLPLPVGGGVFAVCFLLSGIVGLLGVYEFKRAKTTVNPVHVDQASQVVDRGVYAYTRNPMYLGLFLLLFGFAYWSHNLLALTFPFLFVVYMNRFQIQPEEQALEKLFGAQYLDYKQRVRRWI
jgi:protein-S-isoprenylcysteine O-methyltransferase Ste14